jgi:hypothetical protein
MPRVILLLKLDFPERRTFKILLILKFSCCTCHQDCFRNKIKSNKENTNKIKHLKSYKQKCIFTNTPTFEVLWSKMRQKSASANAAKWDKILWRPYSIQPRAHLLSEWNLRVTKKTRSDKEKHNRERDSRERRRGVFGHKHKRMGQQPRQLQTISSIASAALCLWVRPRAEKEIRKAVAIRTQHTEHVERAYHIFIYIAWTIRQSPTRKRVWVNLQFIDELFQVYCVRFFSIRTNNLCDKKLEQLRRIISFDTICICNKCELTIEGFV